MDSELLSLKWNNHNNTFVGIIKVLRKKALYSDATLACEGKFYQVHKLALSGCSDYFAEIFENTPCKNPVIVLKDVSSRCLEFLLDYMYLGEVNVKQSELSELVKAAESLQIKGLAAPDDESDNVNRHKKTKLSDADNVNQHKKTKLSDAENPPQKRRKIKHSQNVTSSVTPSKPISTIILDDPVEVQVKSEPVDNSVESKDVDDIESNIVKKYEDPISIDKEEVEAFPFDPSSSGVAEEPDETWQNYDFEENSPNNESFDPNMTEDQSMDGLSGSNPGPKFVCTFCDYSTNLRSNLKRHERRHLGETRTCRFCAYRSSDGSNLRRHEVVMHRSLFQSRAGYPHFLECGDGNSN